MRRKTLKSTLGVLAAALVLPAALGGCISLFPKAKAVQMYRFGDTVAPFAGGAPAAALVQKGPTIFPPASGGDRLLTTTGVQTAYIGGARWVAPASVMFDDALLQAFDSPGSPRLVERGEPLAAPSTLRLDVRTFEARYPGPVATLQIRAVLIRNADRTVVAEKMFDVAFPASENRQGAIVDAYDKAVDKAIADIRAWTAATAPGK